MSPGAAKRTVALAGVALLAALVSLALESPRHRHHARSGLPEPAATWYSALAAPYNPARSRSRTSCGQRLEGSGPRVLRHEGARRPDRPPRDAARALDLRALSEREYTPTSPTLFVASRFTFEPTPT